MGLEVSFADLHDTTTFFSGNFDVSSVFVTVCCALSIYNGLELLLLVFTTFRRFQGLYFWSLVIASFGLLPYTVGLMIMYFTFTNSVAGLIITCVGWPMLVTGQSLVLYSRLHVVLGQASHRLLQSVKWMIIINAFVFHVSTIVVLFGAYYGPQSSGFAEAYKYIEKIQMTGFTLQEFVLSGIYVWKTLDIIRATAATDGSSTVGGGFAGPTARKRRTSRIMWQLFSINVFIVAMDVALLVIEYQDRHVFQQALKEVVYSVKLKMEFAILSKLVALTAKDCGGGTGEANFTGAFEDYGGTTAGPGYSASVHSGGNGQMPMRDSLFSRTPPRDGQTGLEKYDVAYVERVSGSGGEGMSEQARTAAHRIGGTLTPSVTNDEKQRRRTMEEDLYASALRNLSG